MMNKMRITFMIVSLLAYNALAQQGINDGVFENDPIIPEEIYDVVRTTLRDGSNSVNLERNDYQAKYYCTFRGKWTPDRHPAGFTDIAQFSQVVAYSGTNQLRPWLKNRAVPTPVKLLVERGITTNFEDFMKQERQLLDIVKSRTGFNVDVNDRRFNHVHLPPLRVDANHLWINLIAALSPSPDWFTGFYLFEPFDEISRHFWDQFVLHLYPWDAGTDEGDSYMSVDLPLDPQLPVARFTTTMAKQRSNAFLSPDGATIPHVAEFQCKFWVCGINDDPDGENCNMPDWPPANGCDVLRYPGCERQCTMDQPGCQECKNGEFYFSCCESLTEPMNGDCTSSGTVWRVMGATLVSLVSLWTLLW